MTDQLPYELSPGVTATEEGLELSKLNLTWLSWYAHAQMSRFSGSIELEFTEQRNDNFTWPWKQVSKLLRYREGESSACTFGGQIITVRKGSQPAIPQRPLSRVVTILCDDAEAFRVLHWCIENLGGSDGTA